MTIDRATRAKDFLARILPEETGGGLESTIVPAPAEALLPQGPVPEGLRSDVERTADKVVRGEALDTHEGFILEAIIIPDKRPAIDVVAGDYRVEHPLWMHLNGDGPKKAIRAALPSIGRIELPGHPSGMHGGTGFVVGRNLLMTNRHVAEIFCEGIGRRGLVFRAGHAAGVDFDKQRGGGSMFLAVRSVAMIHPYWDMALLEVEGLPASTAPLRLSTADPRSVEGRDMAVIGYPAFDPRNNTAVQNQVFGGVYDVKRLMPGKLTGRGTIRSFAKDVACALHDSSTLGGASGSAVVDTTTGEVVALHFAGIYLKSNYGVAMADLARDRRVIDAGVNFVGTATPAAGPWDDWWAQAERTESPVVAVAATAGAGPAAGALVLQSPGTGGARWTIPIEISIEVGSPRPAAGAGPGAAGEAVTERAVEPFHETDYSDRRGYDPDFLGLPVPLPEVTDETVLALLEDGSAVVPYHHFSLMMHRKRRLALVTAANVDASPQRRRPEPGRDYGRKLLAGLGENDMERWFTDPRLRGTDQLPDRFFEKDGQAFDKGHLVRRDDIAWGDTYEELRAANGDSFHTTNCSPQVGGFNRSNLQGAWGQLENCILAQARSQRLSYFAGPVLAETDRYFPGFDTQGKVKVQIPEEYWKLVLAVDEGELRAFAFVLRQDVSGLPLEFQVAPQWQRHMVPVAALEEKLAILRFPPAVRAADQFGSTAAEAILGTLGE